MTDPTSKRKKSVSFGGEGVFDKFGVVERDFYGRNKSCILIRREKVILEDDDEIILSLISNDTVENRFEISYASGGYGGGSLQLSPSKKYLIFSYFSGESEEAFALLKIENEQINLLYDSGYFYGEEADYSFVNDEKF